MMDRMKLLDGCDTTLALGLRSLHGAGETCSSRQQQVEPSLTLCHSDVETNMISRPARLSRSSPHSTVNCSNYSFSAAAAVSDMIKKDQINNKDAGVSGEAELCRGLSRASNEEAIDEASSRKKLRLTKEQSAFLENKFKEHSTLNPKQKQALAWQLKLRPRQVEVWFQNRRARTKLKKTEVECELLKRRFAALTDENMRLNKELQELKDLKFSPAPAPLPLFIQLPAATLVICPSCERIAGAAGSLESEASSTVRRRPFLIAANSPKNFFSPFSSHSAAC
ncbi:Homeobox-leucine zipper protein HOX19 [Apostasia shenzhenica]|uniref:Homeobox-leucine zipper protein HOX19 n=1 Tax=Apostasia shenzhenica TaxID=1088818 RepID=A0A2I0A4E4_9ASPA|nr:Homeobox-leucine zipper protein HOX19 [Apostasia shenzhenica]